MPLDRETLGRLQQLQSEATKAPWRVDHPRVAVRVKSGDNFVIEGFGVRSLADGNLIVAAVNALPDLLAAAALGLAVQGLREQVAECFHDSDWGDTGKSRQVFSTYHGAKVLRGLLALLDAPAGAR